MKTLRPIIYFLIFAVGIIILVVFLNQFINGQLNDQKAADAAGTTQAQTATPVATVTAGTPTTSADQTPATTTTETPAATNTTDAKVSTTTTDQAAATSVSTVGLVNQANSYYDVTGTVKSVDSVSIFPVIAGAIKQINFQEGDTVKAGDPIVVLTGANLGENQAETQLKIAAANLSNAQTALTNVQKSNAASLQTANLQLQAAISQANAIPYDLASIQQNQAGVQDGLNILQDSLQTTQSKNSRDANQARSDLNNLIYTLNAAQNDRAQTVQQIQDIQDQLNNLPIAQDTPVDPQMYGSTDPSVTATSSTDQRTALEAQLTKLQAALDAQDKGISDLYTAIDKSKTGYNTLLSAAELGVNQLLSQIQSAQNQSKVLDLSYQSTQTKLGYTGDSSDALKLAQQSFNATKVQLETSLDNAQNQVKIAQLNYDLANNSASGLVIKAPFNGVISSLDLSVGQQVSPQAAVAELINPGAYQMEVNIDPTIADRLDLNAPAKVTLAGRVLEVPIKSIAPTVNATTHLVRVRLALPPITFKANQTLSAELPLTTTHLNADNSGNSTSTTFLPLDAVIIGTESQFVYVNDNGKAKKVEVKLGQISGDQVEILSGLATTDQVILEGAKDLSDGQTISVQTK